MVKMGHAAHQAGAIPAAGAGRRRHRDQHTGGIRDRGGPQEFLTPQRLDFDLLLHVESGAAEHTVDFTVHPLRPGDVLWVRAGQVHQWGAIDQIEGTVVLFGAHTVDAAVGDLIRSRLVRPQESLDGCRPPRHAGLAGVGAALGQR